MAIFLRLLLLLSAASASASGVHDVLRKNGLPKGLLPHSAKHYSLSDDGELAVELKAPCYVHVSDLVYYDRSVTGKLSYGAISELSGIQIKKLFVWLPVSAIEAHPESGTVEFKVAFISLSFPEEDFRHIPDCMKAAMRRGAAGFFAEELLPVSEV